MNRPSGEFELRREERETANELAINTIVATAFLVVLALQISLRLLPRAPVRPTSQMMIASAFTIACSAAVTLYLRGRPPYRRWRKYAIVGGQVALVVLQNRFALAMKMPDFMIGLSIAALSAMIVLAGLRYDNRVVIFAGAFAYVSYSIFVVPAVVSPMRPAFFVFGLVVMGTVTAGMAIVVSSLIELHSESVLNERLARFFPPEVMEQIKAAPSVTLGAVEREVTVLFSDISGFTQRSSQMRPQEVVDLLNNYFPRMVDIVFRYHGTLEKYVGDALLAIWGAPFEDANAAERALRAAIDMGKSAAELKIQIHVGIHSGRVAAGHIGADAYMQYAVIGDTTNVASRICGTASAGEILISQSTRQQLALDTMVILEALPEVHVKGKDEALQLYRVVS